MKLLPLAFKHAPSSHLFPWIQKQVGPHLVFIATKDTIFKMYVDHITQPSGQGW